MPPTTPADRVADIAPVGPHRAELAVVLIAVISGSFLRLSCLGHRGLDVDEFLTYWMSNAPDLATLVERVWQHAGMLPLFFLLERISLGVIGPSELSLRLLPALLGVLTIPLAYLLGRELLGPRPGALAALLIALDRSAIKQAHNARPYTLPLCCLLASAYFFARILRGGDRRDRLGFVVTSSLMVWSHDLFLPVLAGYAVIYLVAIALGSPGARSGRLAASFAAVAALAMPVAWHLGLLFVRRSELVYAEAATLDDWTLFVLPPNLVIAICVGIMVALCAPRWSEKATSLQTRRILAIVLAFVLVPTLGALVVSRVGDMHLFLERYLAHYRVAIYLIGGWLGARWGRGHMLVTASLLLVTAGAAPAMRTIRGDCAHTFADAPERAAIRLLTAPERKTDAILWHSQLIESSTARPDLDAEMREYLTAPLSSFYVAGNRPRCVLVGPRDLATLPAHAASLTAELACVAPGESLAIVARAGYPEFEELVLRNSGLGFTKLEGRAIGYLTLGVFARLPPPEPRPAQPNP